MKYHLRESLFSLILRQFREHFIFYTVALTCLYATHWIGSHLPFFAKELADVLQHNSGEVQTGKFFLLALGIIVFRTSSRLAFFYPARILQKEIRVELLSLLEESPPVRYKNYSPGQLFQVLLMDVDQVRGLIGFALLQVGNIVIILIVLLPKLNSFNSELLMALLPMPIAFIIFSFFLARTGELYRGVQDAQGDVQNFLIESYSGKKTIQNYHAEKSFIELFKSYSLKELDYFYRAGITVSSTLPLMALGTGLSLVWGGHIIYQENLGASSLVLLSGFLFLFMEPLAYVSWIGVIFSRTRGAWDRVGELVDSLETTSQLEKDLSQLNRNEDRGEDADHSFSFHLNFWEKPFHLSLTKERWSVITGKTGHGKTYLLNSIANILKLKNMNFSYVSQDPYLYNDSIIKNIFLGKTPSSLELSTAMEMLALFGLDQLEGNPEKLLKLEVGEHGKRLSGGQAKRLCLVRSLMSGAQIILWDDPFSSVDMILEKEIAQKIREHPYCSHLTILLCSHRISTVRLSDEVIYVEKGDGILEQGRVDKLLKESSLVYEYFENQMV